LKKSGAAKATSPLFYFSSFLPRLLPKLPFRRDKNCHRPLIGSVTYTISRITSALLPKKTKNFYFANLAPNGQSYANGLKEPRVRRLPDAG
jgi:hypothetical protein